ncbi:MAG: thioredoxin-like domain-containing protein [Gemmatimonadota bacterium]
MVWLAWAVAACGSEGPTEPKQVSIPDLFGNQLSKADGSSVGVGTLNGTPVIGIYFASPTCPACAGFTPSLVEAYNELSGEGKPFEVVLVSSGIGESALLAYMVGSGMPWLAVPAGSGKINSLINRYAIRWIPTLVIIDDDGNTISMTGREEVVQSGAAIYDAWLASTSGS